MANIKIPVVAKTKHDGFYPADPYGCDPKRVERLIKEGKVRLNTQVLTNDKADKDVRAALKELVDKYDQTDGVEPKQQQEGGAADERLAELNELDYNRGENSIFAFASKVEEATGDEPGGRDRATLTAFLLDRWDAYEAAKGE